MGKMTNILDIPEQTEPVFRQLEPVIPGTWATDKRRNQEHSGKVSHLGITDIPAYWATNVWTIPANRATHGLVLKYLTSHLLQKTKAKDGQQSYFDADTALDYTDAGPECLGTEHFQATSYFPQHS